MRLVAEPAQLAAALQGARSEAQSAFGSGELLLERALLAPRHVEVQVFADAQGHCIHLGERDCSVQRRHQKLIEETPSPAVDAALRERMGRCAVALAQAAGYVGAGTVDFLLDRGEFFLMEMNTRLQVEHPVTEMVTGLDLVEWQLRIARGEPLPLAQDQVSFNGHAIEVRLCAEDEHFTPHAGTVRRFRAPDGVRFDHALFEGLEVPPYYDSMLGKLIVHAATREEAIDRLASALDRTELLGLPSNRALLAACLRHPVFRDGQALIPFLAQHGDALREALQKEELSALNQCGLAAVFTWNGGASTQALPCPFPRPVRLRHRGTPRDLAVGGLPPLPHGVAAARVDGTRWHLQQGGRRRGRRGRSP
jgi:3-methylcrotonyl-CoA carboxylase alpha subunit/geranyl-CoA carboxylase alpha subunit